MWRRRDRTVFILNGEIEAAARLAMHIDFDLRAFDAFCHCIEYSPYTLQRDSPAPTKEGSPQYEALCDWLLGVCRELIEPPMLQARHKSLRRASASTFSGDDSLDIESGGAGSGYGAGARERFAFFRQRVLKARIWQDRGQTLFRRLRLAATQYMDQIEPMCDARYQVLCSEPGAMELLSFGDKALEISTDQNRGHRLSYLSVVSKSSIFRPSYSEVHGKCLTDASAADVERSLAHDVTIPPTGISN